MNEQYQLIIIDLFSGDVRTSPLLNTFDEFIDKVNEYIEIGFGNLVSHRNLKIGNNILHQVTIHGRNKNER